MTAAKRCKKAVMPDRGLQEVVCAAGDVTDFACRLGISQPSVSNWTRVPTERVVTVEAAIGAMRVALRRNLYGDLNMTAAGKLTSRVRIHALWLLATARRNGRMSVPANGIGRFCARRLTGAPMIEEESR